MAKWLESTGYAQMKVQSDAEQSIEHLLKAVKSMCTADMIVQRVPVKSHASQGHIERAARLVENQYRAVLFDVQERTRVEIDPISCSISMDIETFRLASQQIPATHRRSNIIRTSHWKSPTDLRFPWCSQRLSVWCHRIENLEEFSWLRKEPPRRFRSMWFRSHGRERRTSCCERGWTYRACENDTTMAGKRESLSRLCQAHCNSFVSQA